MGEKTKGSPIPEQIQEVLRNSFYKSINERLEDLKIRNKEVTTQFQVKGQLKVRGFKNL